MPNTTNQPVVNSGDSRIITTSQKFIDLVVHFECSGDVKKYLKAYLDSANVPTIGIGTTFYPDGSKVKLGDKCTITQAYEYFNHEVLRTVQKVESLTRNDITQGMFDALVDFAYNLGTGALQSSTLLKKVNANPTDYAGITAEFVKWSKARNPKTGQLETLKGLLRRRQCEAYLYQYGKNAQGFTVS
ncbi:MAG: lysozyme [Bacteroidetes bacterium]|nr:lysozyme [Bacteroidota bacterium]